MAVPTLNPLKARQSCSQVWRNCPRSWHYCDPLAEKVKARLAVVEDDPVQADLLAEILRGEDFEVSVFHDAKSALTALETDVDPAQVVLTDLTMSPMSGIDLCRALKESRPDLPVLVITGEAKLETAVSALRAGAYDFLVKPVEPALLSPIVQRAVERHRLVAELARQGLPLAPDEVQLFGESEVMDGVRRLVARVAPSGASILIQGETGTGKELVARAVHASSPRSAAPFVAINCAALPASLLESELFGYAKGAFTDARAARTGLFVEASGGTIFLDEIGELSLDNQAKLLRALQEHRGRPLGSNAEVAFDARVLCATNRDLEGEVKAGRFREDLFYRLNVICIALPPLRERGMDVVHLATRFLRRICERDQRPALRLGPTVAERLLAYYWPGNVRELENCVERLVTLATGEEVRIEDLPESLRSRPAGQAPVAQAAEEIVPLDEHEKRYVLHVLRLLQDNRSRAAKLLKIDRRTLYRRLEGWGVPVTGSPPEAEPE